MTDLGLMACLKKKCNVMYYQSKDITLQQYVII